MKIHRMHFSATGKPMRWTYTTRIRKEFRVFPKVEDDYITQFYVANASLIRFVGVNYERA